MVEHCQMNARQLQLMLHAVEELRQVVCNKLAGATWDSTNDDVEPVLGHGFIMLISRLVRSAQHFLKTTVTFLT